MSGGINRTGEWIEGAGEALGRDAELAVLKGTIALQREHFLGFCFRLLHAFDPLLAMRTEQVVEISRTMGQSGVFEASERETFRTASWLFDIGLVSVPRNLLMRMREASGRVGEDEVELFQHHPVIGQTLAAFVDPLRSVGEVIRAHHERFDGSGYPDGLAGDRIPWVARCLAVAVAYVESGLPPLEAAERIQGESGAGFDPEAVRLFFQTHPVTKLPRNVREVLMAELEEGMHLAKGITTRAGVLLVPAGQELSAVLVAKLKNHARLHLVTERILVFR
jgi:HD-GYP domain-containing protein (c-di-GMP phosphodiesterase class II)